MLIFASLSIGEAFFISLMVIKEKTFKKFLSEEEILTRISRLATKVNKDYIDKNPLFIAILNGSFMFAADIMKKIKIPSEISFVKVASYEEMESTGNVKGLIGLNENIFNRHVVILEDIIDSGRTITKILEEFRSLGAASVEVVSLLLKPECYTQKETIRYVGFEIPDKFVVGYGLDYDGQGRNLPDIYQLKE